LSINLITRLSSAAAGLSAIDDDPVTQSPDLALDVTGEDERGFCSSLVFFRSGTQDETAEIPTNAGYIYLAGAIEVDGNLIAVALGFITYALRPIKNDPIIVAMLTDAHQNAFFSVSARVRAVPLLRRRRTTVAMAYFLSSVTLFMTDLLLDNFSTVIMSELKPPIAIMVEMRAPEATGGEVPVAPFRCRSIALDP